MVAPSYTTDLQTIDLAENTTTWNEMADWGGGGTIYEDEQDYLIQGAYCTSQIATKTGLQDITSLVTDYGSDLAGSFTPGETCVFMWHVFLPANALDTFAGGGTRLIVGANLDEFDAWKVGGNDFGRNPYGGWQNVAVDPSFTPDYLDDGAVGNGGVYQWFGSGVYLLRGIGKGAPHGVDAIRYGRGTMIVSGGSALDGYCTFTEMATANDQQSERWGLFQEQAGGYLWKGLISLGTSTASAGFVDSNQVINVENTPRTYASFNKIEINNLDSTVSWTGILITSLDASSLSIGEFEVIDNAIVGFDNCTFTDMSTFIFKSNSTIDDTTFRRCGSVTQGSAVFDGCSFDTSPASASLYADDLDNVDNCDFESDGSNHAVVLGVASSGASYTFVGNTFVNYASVSGSTGNEVVYNNSGGHINISVGTGQIPSFRNGIGSTTTITGSVPIFIVVKDTDGDPIQNVQTGVYLTSDRTELVNQDTDVDGEVDTSYSGSTPVEVEVRLRKSSSGATKYKNYSSLQNIVAVTGLSLAVTMIEDPNNNATT